MNAVPKPTRVVITVSSYFDAIRRLTKQKAVAHLMGVHGMNDNGRELINNAILAWRPRIKVDWHYIAPGKPMQNWLH